MTVRTFRKDQAPTATMGDQSVVRIQWVGLQNGDTGAPVSWTEWSDRTLHVWAQDYTNGTASVGGTGGSVSIEGSNDYDPVSNNVGSWAVLNDANGGAMTYLASSGAQVRSVTEAPLWIRPHVTAGDGTTSCNVAMVARRLQPMITGG